ncbi:MAG: caspase family protein, partial [Nitrospirae bacterium]|nr:caspase family protein [Nitrospirota bacterium]
MSYDKTEPWSRRYRDRHAAGMVVRAGLGRPGARYQGHQDRRQGAGRVRGRPHRQVLGRRDRHRRVRESAKLRYAVADAKGVGSALEARGFQVTGLYNEQATRRNILGELGDRLVERVGENDLVLIFFAGHGDTKTAKGGKTMGYLLPVEGAQAALSETAFSMTTIRDLADALPAKHVLFVIDVCYGGIAGTQGRALP